jgi:hypothetical protein
MGKHEQSLLAQALDKSLVDYGEQFVKWKDCLFGLHAFSCFVVHHQRS